MKYHIIYKTTNLINDKFYIGKHSTDNLDDGYLGSSQHLKSAIKKYGKENFKREILVFCDSEQDAYLKEAELVTMEVVNDPNSYNKMPGGEGSQKRYTDDEIKEHVREYKRVNKEQIREYQREYKREWYQANKEYHRECCRKWLEDNPEYHRKWREDNRERKLEYKLVKMVKLARQKYLSK